MSPDAEYFERIEEAIESIVVELVGVLSGSEVAYVREWNVEGEYGVAFEALCGFVADGKHAIERGVYQRIVDLGLTMGIDAEWWARINVR